MNASHRIGYLLLLLLLGLPLLDAQSYTATSGYAVKQTFDSYSFKHPVKLPKTVLDVLIATKEAAYARDWAEEHPRGDLNRFFLAIPVHLSDSDEEDYIVLGQYELTGADCDFFWVVHSVNSRPHSVLWSNGTTLQLLPGRHDGLNDIRMDWWAGNGYGWADTFQFNGTKYVRVRRRDTYRKLK